MVCEKMTRKFTFFFNPFQRQLTEQAHHITRNTTVYGTYVFPQAKKIGLQEVATMLFLRRLQYKQPLPISFLFLFFQIARTRARFNPCAPPRKTHTHHTHNAQHTTTRLHDFCIRNEDFMKEAENVKSELTNDRQPTSFTCSSELHLFFPPSSIGFSQKARKSSPSTRRSPTLNRKDFFLQKKT